jgi:heat shock protein HslJ
MSTSKGARGGSAARLLVLLVIAAVFAACSGSDAGPSRSTAPASLAGTAWKAILVGGQPVVPGREPMAAFSTDQVKGTGGCNAFNGSYQYRPGAITFGDLASTAMGCEDPVGTVEGRFSGALSGATSVFLDPAGRLIMDGLGGRIVFEVAG